MVGLSKYCTPAKLYLALLVVSVIFLFFQNAKILTIVFKIVFGLVWGWLLNFLCKKGYKTLSWVLVLLPFVLLLLTTAIAMEVISQLKHTLNVVQLQPISKQ